MKKPTEKQSFEKPVNKIEEVKVDKELKKQSSVSTSFSYQLSSAKNG